MVKSAEDQPSDKGASVLTLILVFVLGFTAFTFIGFLILMTLLSLGILPAI